jgi:thioredoxin reductase
MDLDVIIVGGGPAGCSAALVLGRCRRRVLVIDSGRPRNAASHAMHALISRDGMPPAEFLAAARADALRYPTVQWRDGFVVNAWCEPNGFGVELQDGTRLASRKLLLATGVVDEVPRLAGIERFYGRSVHHCPYCDAFEHSDEALAVYGRGEKGVGLALMMSLWSADVMLFTDGDDPEARAADERLRAHGIALQEAPIAALEGDDDGRLRAVVLRDDTRVARDAMFFATGRHQRSPLPERLGCRLDDGAVATDRPLEETSVPGVYVAGDASKDLLLVVVAAAEGAKAAFAINRTLCRDEGRH